MKSSRHDITIFLIPSPLDFGVLISNILSDFGADYKTSARPPDLGVTTKLWSLAYIMHIKYVNQNLISGHEIQYDSLVKVSFFELFKKFMAI